MIGIYQIYNVITCEFYIGSSKNIKERFRRHKKDLRKKKHHSIILQRAWDKYGEESFIFEILEECKIEELYEKENKYLREQRPFYNICQEARSTFGRKYSEETRLKHRKYALENNVRPPKETYEKRYVPVQMLDKQTEEIIQTFKSLTDACIAIGKTNDFASTISSVCKGKRKSAFGYKWKFLN